MDSKDTQETESVENWGCFKKKNKVEVGQQE